MKVRSTIHQRVTGMLHGVWKKEGGTLRAIGEIPPDPKCASKFIRDGERERVPARLK